MKNFLLLLSLILLNFVVFYVQKDLSIRQLIEDDFRNFEFLASASNFIGYALISSVISFTTLSLKIFFKPFIEIYLLYFRRYSFYFFINLISISSTYIVFRVYGYSRLILLFYLLISSILLYFSDR